MSDFLDRLATRSLGISKLVRPVIGPRFGPEPRLESEKSIRGLGERKRLALEEPAGKPRRKGDRKP